MLLNTERRQEVIYTSDSLSFKVLLCIDGCGILSYCNETLKFYRDDCFFIPVDSYPVTLHEEASFCMCGDNAFTTVSKNSMM